jgi:hypothetical protein
MTDLAGAKHGRRVARWTSIGSNDKNWRPQKLILNRSWFRNRD